MDKIINKKTIKKIAIIILIVTLFSFVMPKSSNAGIVSWAFGKLTNFFARLTFWTGDVIWDGVQFLFMGESLGDGIKFSPGTIFAGQIPIFDIDFINPNPKDGGFMANSSIAYKLQRNVATWFKTFREFALVGLLCVLVYIAIRMIITSSSSDKAKYKKMLAGWFEAMCILFVLHFIIALSFTAVKSLNNTLSSAFATSDGTDGFANSIREEIRGVVNDDNENNDAQAAVEIIIFWVLLIYTFSFSIQYIKRVIYLAFLILISPLIALTYPLDKLKDGRAQAFEVWIKEFVYNLLLQPVHLIIYTLLLANVKEIMDVNSSAYNPFYALAVIASMLPADKFIRKIFGLESSESSGTMASALGGAAIMNGISKLGKSGGAKKSGTGQGGSGANASGNNRIRTANVGATSKKMADGEADVYASLRENNSPQEGILPEYQKRLTEEEARKLETKLGKQTSKQTSKQARKQTDQQTETKRKQTKVKNKPKTKKGKHKKKGGGSIRKYAPKVMKGFVRGTTKIAGAATLGTIGLAAGLATGDLSKAAAGLTGGIIAGNKLGRSIADREINAVNNISNKLGRKKEIIKGYDKLVAQNPGKEEIIDEIIDAGIIDTAKIKKALNKPYDVKKAIAYMKMAEKCPSDILKDDKEFKTYLARYGISENQADEIKREVESFL